VPQAPATLIISLKSRACPLCGRSPWKKVRL
jgi:hypothetical protein